MARQPPGGEFGRNSQMEDGRALPEGQVEKVFLKKWVQRLGDKTWLPSKPRDFGLVFQIPIRNPIIKRD